MSTITNELPMPVMDPGGADVPKSKNTLGKDDFVKLLMTQLRHQDPLNPMDQQQFAAQLAQFGQLEQLTNIGSGIQNLRTGMGDSSKLQALGMIGKRVKAGGSEVDLIQGENVNLTYAPKPEVTPIKVGIYDQGGRIVRELDLGSHPQNGATEGTIQWDGKSQDGSRLPAGKYTFRVQGVDQHGQAQELGTELSGRVTGVDVDGSQPTLIIDTGNGKTRLSLNKIRQVSVDSSDGLKPAKNSALIENIPGKNTFNAPSDIDASSELGHFPMASASLERLQP